MQLIYLPIPKSLNFLSISLSLGVDDSDFPPLTELSDYVIKKKQSTI